MRKILYSIAVMLLAAFNSNAQKDHVSQAHFYVDSVDIHLLDWHTQSPEQDTISYASIYVWHYFKVENDTLYSDIPEGYIYYEVDDPMTGRTKYNKEMVTVETENITHWFRVADLIGKHVAICCMKIPAYISLSL